VSVNIPAIIEKNHPASGHIRRDQRMVTKWSPHATRPGGRCAKMVPLKLAPNRAFQGQIAHYGAKSRPNWHHFGTGPKTGDDFSLCRHQL